MGILGGFTEFRFVYCAHQHEDTEPCNRQCHHDANCHHEKSADS